MKTVKVLEETLKLLKVLKDSKNSKSYGELIDELVTAEMMKTHALTNDGFLKEGSVVEVKGVTVVITQVDKNTVFFSNRTYVVNGGEYCRNLKVLSKDVKSYKGEPVNE